MARPATRTTGATTTSPSSARMRSSAYFANRRQPPGVTGETDRSGTPPSRSTATRSRVISKSRGTIQTWAPALVHLLTSSSSSRSGPRWNVTTTCLTPRRDTSSASRPCDASGSPSSL